MTETVAIRLNKRRLIENLRFAFPNRYSVVTELLQNARRAGATCVDLTYVASAKRLVVRDDGCGIADFQALLTLGESGWSEAVQRTEHPFGLGFLQSLYAAGSCAVESNGQRVRFDTRAALDGATVNVERGNDARGTTVTLEAVELPQLEREIVRMTRGFPIPVRYNGVFLRRPHAPDALPFVETSIGAVHLAGVEDGAATWETAVYLQGLMIEGPRGLGLPCNVVHLDPAVFQARLPDRDRLMEQEAQLRKVEKVLRDAVAGSPDRGEAGRDPGGVHRAVLPCGEDVGARRSLRRRAAAPRGRAPARGRVSEAGRGGRQGFPGAVPAAACPK